MSDTEKPIHAPTTGRPREATEARVSRSVSISAAAARMIDLNLALLKQREPHATAGRVIDRMATFCEQQGFVVIGLIPATNRKKPRTASTPPGATNSRKG